MSLRGEPLLRRTVRTVLRGVDRVIVAVPDPQRSRAVSLLTHRCCCDVVGGGTTRRDCLAAALAVLPPEARVVVVQDATRCLAPPALLDSVLAAMDVPGSPAAVIPVLSVADTVKQVDDAGQIVSTRDRSALRATQEPYAVLADALRRAEPGPLDVLDDPGTLAQHGFMVRSVPGDPQASPVTSEFDLLVADAMIDRS